MVKRLWNLGKTERWKMWVQLLGQWLSELLVVSIVWAGSQWILLDKVNPIWYWIIGLQLLVTLIYLLAIRKINKNGWAVAASRDLQDRYLNAYLKSSDSSSDVMLILHQDLRTLKSVAIFFDTIIPTILQLILTGVVVIVVTLVIHPISLLIPVAGILLLGMGMGMLQGLGDKTNLAYIKSFNHMGQRFLDDFLGMSTLIMNGRQHHYAKDFKNDSENFRQKTMGVLEYQLQSLTIMDFCLYGTIGFFLLAQGHAVIAGSLTLTSAIGLSTLTAIWLIDFRKFGYFIHVFVSTLPKIKHLFTVIDDATEMDSSKSNQISKVNKIDFSGEFGYHQTLFSINEMTLVPGELIGLTGPSGSGKSTLAKTMMQQISLLSGQIKLNDETNLNKIDPLSWFKHVGYLGPTTVLFDGTIEDNLLLGSQFPNWQQRLIDLKLCQFVNDLPKGFKTPVGENGAQLSPGQRQQIAVARAILSDKDVFIFDEVTSNIDPENADMILDVIKHLAKDKIVLLITHRLADLRQLSKLYLINQQKLVMGDFDSLQQNVPKFKQLVSEQETLLKEAGLK